MRLLISVSHTISNYCTGLGNNRNIVKDVESSLFVLCLDKDIPKAVFEEENNASIRAVQCLTGFNSRTNAGNRWHDKTVQVGSIVYFMLGEGCIKIMLHSL